MVLFGSGELKKSLGLFALIAYGVGDILGAGVYALIGKTAGLVGTACWLTFLASLFVAALTGLSYAELSSRFPRAAGESFYSLQAFRSPLLSFLIGFLVLLSGMVSMAVVSHAFAGYLQALWPSIPTQAVILIFFLGLGVINIWGMKESSITNIICTAVEVTGILIVIVAGLKFFGQVNYFEITPPPDKPVTTAFFQASLLAFYAFIGFEDMVKAAEESHQPERFIPLAILVSLAVVSVLYVGTAVAAVSVIPTSELVQSSAPLMLVVERGFPQIPRGLFTLIALFAVTNTALVNFVMGSRLLYGMAREGLAPSFLGWVHPVRHTPLLAIGAVFLVALILALTGTLIILAQSTALVLLLVYFLMNLSLCILKLRVSGSRPFFQVPAVIPVVGALSCLVLILYAETHVHFIILGILTVGLFLYFSGPRRLR